jgi:hypothetical protein
MQTCDEWIAESGPTFVNVDAEDSAAGLIEMLRRSPTRETLIEVCCGEFHRTVAGRVVREDAAQATAAEYRAQGLAVNIEPADDVGRGVKCVRVTALKRRPNLHTLRQNGSITRRVVTFALEDASRLGGLVMGDVQASLRAGREIFRHCLMYGRAPDQPATNVELRPAPALDGASLEQLDAKLAGSPALHRRRSQIAARRLPSRRSRLLPWRLRLRMPSRLELRRADRAG